MYAFSIKKDPVFLENVHWNIFREKFCYCYSFFCNTEADASEVLENASLLIGVAKDCMEFVATIPRI